MLNLVLITRADWSQQGLSLWGNRGLRLISPRLLITKVLVSWIRELQSIFLSYANKDLIFLGHFSCHWIIAIDWPVKKYFFPPRGFQAECGTLEWAIPILAWAVCTRCLCAQTKPTKPKRTRTSPARSHTPNETKGKEMPRNQKPKDINVKCDFPVLLDLWPGRLSASSLFSSDTVSSNFLLVSCTEDTLSFPLLEASR